MTDPSGYFTSLRFPKKYPKNNRVRYTISTNESVTISCHFFELQEPNKKGNCRDYLNIIDKVKTKYCGKNGPQDYVSEKKFLTLWFKSNKRKQLGGFNCSYSVLSLLEE